MRPTASPRHAIEAAAMADLEAAARSNNNNKNGGINNKYAYRYQQRRKRTKPRRNMFTCFNILLFLAMFEATTLICIGLFSDHLSLHDFWMRSGLEHVVLARLLEDAQNRDDDMVELENHLIQRAEDQLLSSDANDIDDDVWANATPIDDYYSRPHIIDNKVPLVVGGSDGSGTRAFVDVLAHLGVPMLVDDHGTMDVHGNAMFHRQGWPPLATMILQNTHSANYEMDSLPKDIRNTTTTEIGNLGRNFQKRYGTLLTRIQERNVSVANHVTFGFKAPVSMLAVPILNEHFGPMKYLHVVRDGRDVALSSNQSPVKKFYKDAYKDGEQRMAQYSSNVTQGKETGMESVMGIQLWNDWNTELFQWERKHANGKIFDFLVMRTEDLLSPAKKFESLVQLADFVGSPRTMEELCCLSREAVKDMGVSGQPGRRQRRDYAARRREREEMRRIRRRDKMWTGETIDLSKRGIFTSGEEESASITQLDVLKEMTPTEREEYLSKMTDAKRTDLITDIQAQHDVERSDHFKEIERRMSARLSRKRERDERYQERHRGRRVGIAPDLVMGSRRRLVQYRANRESRRGRGSRESLRARIRSRRYPRIDNSLEWIEEASRAGGQLTPGGRQDDISDRRFGRLSDRLSGYLRDHSSWRRERRVSVDKRYGKWAKILGDKPELSAKLHEEGSEGLAAFGYEPRGRFQDRRKEDDSFICDEHVICEESDEEQEEQEEPE